MDSGEYIVVVFPYLPHPPGNILNVFDSHLTKIDDLRSTFPGYKCLLVVYSSFSSISLDAIPTPNSQDAFDCLVSALPFSAQLRSCPLILVDSQNPKTALATQ
ncbi:hypothetical protein BsWGS_03069 [Bradybaena similaris]